METTDTNVIHLPTPEIINILEYQEPAKVIGYIGYGALRLIGDDAEWIKWHTQFD
jgi:hypothetical protein